MKDKRKITNINENLWESYQIDAIMRNQLKTKKIFKIIWKSKKTYVNM